MAERRQSFIRQRRDLLIFGTLLLLFMTFSVIKLSALNEKNAQFTQDLREGLIRSCEQNGNPLREFVRDQALAQIEQSQVTDYSVFFPGVDPQVLHDAIHAQNQQTLTALKNIQPIDCASVYR